MTTTDAFTERVMRVVARSLDVDRRKLSLETTFEELHLDSIDGLDLFFALEEELDVDLPDEEARNIGSIGELVRSLRILVGEDERETSSEPGEPSLGSSA